MTPSKIGGGIFTERSQSVRSPGVFSIAESRNIAHKRHSSVLTQRPKPLKEIRQLGYIKPAREESMAESEDEEDKKEKGDDYTFSPHINFPTSNLVINNKSKDVSLKKSAGGFMGMNRF